MIHLYRNALIGAVVLATSFETHGDHWRAFFWIAFATFMWWGLDKEKAA